MKINSVSIQNFYSIQNIEVVFDNFRGIVIVKGKNLDTGGSNGSGKSALFEAVVWGLFGKTIRKSNEDALVNNVAKKKCSVTVIVNDNILITRGRKPSKLELSVDDKLLTKSTMQETQTYIEQLLNTNYKVFMASMVFGQHNNVDFLGATPEDKRIIIRNFLNLDNVFSMRDRIRGYKSTYNSEIKEKGAVIDEHLRVKKDIELKLKAIKSDKSYYAYDNLDSTISLNDILDRERQTRLLEESAIDLQRERKQLRLDASRGRQLSALGYNECPTCGNKTDVDKKLVKKRCDSADEKIERISKKLVNLEKEAKSLDIPPSSSEYSKYMEYRELCSKEDTYKEFLLEVDDKIVNADIVKRENTKNYDVMRFWEKAFSEQGLIRYIIRNILEYFNDKCNTYLSYLTDSQMLLFFNEELKETLTVNGKITHYISLSGGERRKINLAVMLALQSLLTLTEKDQSNLLFFDEIAENLDSEGLKGLYILLQELKKDKTLFLVTHNKALKTLFDNAERLTIIKENGVSRLWQ